MEFLYVYMAVSIVLLVGGLFYAGMNEDGYAINAAILLPWLWPFFLCLSPFFGIYLLGVAYAEQRSKKRRA